MSINESFPARFAVHICGGGIRICNTCNRQFCTQCESTPDVAYKTIMKSCCRKAILEFWTAPIHETLEKEDSKSAHIKVGIKEITDGKL